MKSIRFTALLVTVSMMVGTFTGCSNTQKVSATQYPKVLIGLSIRGLDNPYYVQIKQGAEMFIKTLPPGTATLQVMESGGSDEKQINDIKDLIARGGKNTILYVDPNQAPDAAEIARVCEAAGVYWSTCWSMADGVVPADYKYYVLHQTGDDTLSGYTIAVNMFKSFKNPGHGKILAVQGMLANTAAINRFKGLEKALKEYPGVTLVAHQDAGWNPQQALNITQTWLSKYNDIDGIWAANDQMALGAIQALKAKGLNKKVAVVGIDTCSDAITAIENGDMLASICNNPWGQAGYALNATYDAYRGKLDPSKMKTRMFYTKSMLITKDTVAAYKKTYVTSSPVMNFKNLNEWIARPLVIGKQ